VLNRIAIAALRCVFEAVWFVRSATLPCFQPQGNALFFNLSQVQVRVTFLLRYTSSFVNRNI